MIFLNVRTRFCCHIDLLTHREAVTGYPAGHRLASLYTFTCSHENLYLCVDVLKAKEYHHNLILIHMSQTTQFHDATSLSSSSAYFTHLGDSSKVTSVSDFIEKVVMLNKEAGTQVFYRGHADENWELKPSIFRKPNGVEIEHQLFRDMVAHTPQSFSGCKSALDYLVQMQHYELPTRLLDVSTNPLVALYFACQSAEDVVAGMKAGAMAGGLVFEKIRSEEPKFDSLKRSVQDRLMKSAYMVGALAGASDAPSLDVKEVADTLSSIDLFSIDRIEDKDEYDYDEILRLSQCIINSVVELSPEVGAKARSKEGAVYLFSIPEDRVKHYDSDTVSILANLAKCNDQEIDITEQAKDEIEGEVLKRFNETAGTQILLHQIKEEKPYFDPLIRPNDLSSIFLVKAKYGNPRIINQAGAFFIFGLGLSPSSIESERRLTKRGDHETLSAWIRHKFIIPKEKKQDILDELARMGITESYLFPEMDKYAKELKKKYEL